MEVVGCSTGKSFRFVRVCVRAVWLPSGVGSQILWAGLFPFPFWLGLVVGLFLFWSWVVLGSFPFSLLGLGAFPFPFLHPPNLLSNFSWAYREGLNMPLTLEIIQMKTFQFSQNAFEIEGK